MNAERESNRISTSKYTWYNSFPKILIEQFSKMANIYFLLIAIMQSIHEISISGGKPVILLPLSVVIFINGLKDFFEDWKRKLSDDEENNRLCLILNAKKKIFEKKTWADVKLGDCVKVLENESFPADMILINSSEESGLCYKETKNLDGETNLKYLQAHGKLAEIFRDETSLSYLTGIIECKPPNEFIYEFDAKLKLDINSDECIYIDRNSFMLRGCSLKQTQFVYGVVVYVGHNTKIMKNSPSARTKRSKIEHIMNFQITVIFCVQLLLSLTGALFYMYWYINYFEELKSYIFVTETERQNLFLMFFSRIGTWILIFTNLVPISLLVTMDMVKYIQGMFMSWDINIYDTSRKIPARVQTSTLNEELGQVRYIFTDKTGTLTKNFMEFRRMSIGNFIYGDRTHSHKRKTFSDNFGDITNVNFNEHEQEKNKFLYHKKDQFSEYYHNIQLFLEAISLCHTVITDPKEEQTLKIVYQASSPDEMCLVNAARYFNYVFQGRDINNKIFLNINGKQTEFQLMNLLEYSSERKRMSVIVRSSDNKIKLFCKGADSVIKDRITQNKKLLNVSEQHLHMFAKDGLRTLMIAYKEMSENEYKQWSKEYMKAISDPNQKDKLLPDVLDQVEKDMYLIGATAIEDQLQDDVGETLEVLMKAGIKIWMLTGDKMDTAKSIAFSCKLLAHEFNLLEVSEKSSKVQIRESLIDKLKEIENQPDAKYGLVISTDEISKIMSDSVLTEVFYELSIRCHAVVCCRVTPKQKAQMVHVIKDKDDNITLAIGDGANDVNMITSAHIGVGIIGVEGTQAARSSDYSIGEFSFLRRLLLVHGRESYRKNSFVVCYNFYKNVIFVMPQFWFGYVSYFSGQTLYDRWIYQLYNILFASIPIIWFGIYDKEKSYDELYNDPEYYTQGIVGKLFHSIRFWKWVLYGMWQAFIIFFLSYYSLSSPRYDGMVQDMWSIGSHVYAAIVIIVNVKILLATNTHCYISFVLFFISIALYWIVLIIMSNYFRFENFNNLSMLLLDGWLYLSLISTIALVFAIDIGSTRLLYYFGVIKDGKEIKANKIDEHLKENIIQTNLDIEEKIRTQCIYHIFIFLDFGEAFSQEKGQAPPLLKKITI